MKIRDTAATIISLFGALVFTDSLRYKFSDHPKTQVIFGALNDWAATLGAGGLFAHSGLFSQYVIGSAELVASALLILGLVPGLTRLNALGAMIAAAVMTGAVSFHLFTPLGIDPNNDGGGLFIAASTLLMGSLALLVLRRVEIGDLMGDLRRALVPKPLIETRDYQTPSNALS